MWDARYAEEGFAYGTEPNAFLVANAASIRRGPVLCIAEGEGRNAVWLAGRGFEVHAVDASRVGVEKTLRLARERGVTVDARVGDLADVELGRDRWGAIVSIFCHLPPELRRDVHRRVVEALAPGGVFLLEAYTPRQLEHGTGGPPVPALLMEPDALREELAGLTFDLLQEVERDVVEGRYHTGRSAVVQVVARKPEPGDHP